MPHKCKIKQKESAHRHYLNNKAKLKARALIHNRATKERLLLLVRTLKEASGCVECGIKDFRVLDFHHLRDKVANVADAVRKCWSEARVRAEIAKCEVLCANCHRIETYENFLPEKRHSVALQLFVDANRALR
jgi:hypothetical protein